MTDIGGRWTYWCKTEGPLIRTVKLIPHTGLIRHGCFKWYLNRFGLQELATCIYCRRKKMIANHALFKCKKYDMEREKNQ